MVTLVQVPTSNRNLEGSNKKVTKPSQFAVLPKYSQKKTFKHMKSLALRSKPSSQLVMFVVKVVALDIVRRISNRNCPTVWHVLQAVQVVAFPPIKWIRGWPPIKNLARGIQVISRPLLFLSIATAFSGHSQCSQNNSVNAHDSKLPSDSDTSESNSSKRFSNESSDSVTYDKKLLSQLHNDLEKQGIVLPERISDDELQRFYIAANGDFSCLLQSLKKTIHWRKNYQFFSTTELETWSHLAFWHGSDVKERPCLIIRLGLACSSVVPREMPHFTKAIVSQIEHGVLCLMNGDDPRITVLVDCEGLSPLKFPTKTLRSCSTLMQDHYPNQLAALMVIRLPPVTRVIAQTFIQVLKPATRGKLQIVGDTNLKVLSEFFHSLPSFLGGDCTCSLCCTASAPKFRRKKHEICKDDSHRNPLQNEFHGVANGTEYVPSGGSRITQTRIIGVVVVFWVLFVLARRVS